MDCIVYYTASVVLSALEYDPFTCVNFGYLNLSLADIEREVTSYASFRTKCLQTPKQWILDIDSQTETTRPIIPPEKSLPGSSSFQISQVASKMKVANSSRAQLPYHYGHPPSYHQTQDHRVYPCITTVPQSQPSWISDQTPGLGTHSYNGSLLSTPSRLHSARTELHNHGYLTRHSSTGFDFNGSHMSYISSEYSRSLPPPPPYSASHVSLNLRQFSAASRSGHEIKTEQNQPLQEGAFQADDLNNVTGSKSDMNYPKPLMVSPTKKIALDESAAMCGSIKSSFYLVC